MLSGTDRVEGTARQPLQRSILQGAGVGVGAGVISNWVGQAFVPPYQKPMDAAALGRV